MKLYLSSYRLGNNPHRLLDLLGENRQVAIISNARDNADPIERAEKLHKDFEDITSLGLTAQEIDLRNFFDQPENLATTLEPFGMVWVRGGNTFILRRAMADSGFDAWLQQKRSDPNFVYAGYSAGVCVLAPHLRGLELVDHPEEVEQVYQRPTIWEGLGIVPYLILPHYQSDHHESALIEQSVQYCRDQQIAYQTLRDGEVIISEA